jgi:hypothetical protein
MAAGSLTEVPIMPQGPLSAARAHDQADWTRQITPYKWVHPDG